MPNRHVDFIGDGPPVNPPRGSERSPERPVPRDAHRPGLEASHHIPIDALTQTESFATFEARLESWSVDERLGAVKQFPAWGGVAVPPLCAALMDRDERVRIAAAAGLAEVGDGRAIQPLVDALRACTVLGSARARRWLAIAIVVLLTAFLARWLVIAPTSPVIGNLLCVLFVGMFWRLCVGDQRDRSAACAAISEAIGKVAERHSGPDLHRVLPDLWAVSCDHLLQGRAARIAAREAASRIECLTANRRELPLAAAPPALDGASLPRVSLDTSASDPVASSEPEPLTRG